MAEILSRQYASAISQPKYSASSTADLFPDVISESNPQQMPADKPQLSDIHFTESDLLEAIEELKPNSASGPDEFPSNLLVMCRHSQINPLYTIWRSSMSSGVVPAVCKFANIIPIHKGKSKVEANNYRPVALTSLLVKIFEKVIRKQLVSFMEEPHLFNKFQHGFRSGRSCLSQLLAHFDNITQLLEQGFSVNVIYLDFAKAFNKVDIGLMLQKFKFLGIGGTLGRWIDAFLLGRLQNVEVHGQKSTPIQVLSGVPQGSVLGPLHFLVLITDIDTEVVSTFISSFADNTRIGNAITNHQDIKKLQEDLEAVYW